MAPKTKCYYKVLEVPKSATEAQIKRKYKELALKYHPDKNLQNVETCKTKFQSIKQAYDILSDPEQKKLYDEFRGNISRNGGDFQKHQENQRNNFGEDGKSENCYVYVTDVSFYSNTSAFKGFSDRDDGFYSVYRKLFEILSEEEDNGNHINSSTFGKSTSNYETIVEPFYAYWSQYRAAENRRSASATAERTKEIRALVRFVRRADKRVTKHLDKLKAEKFAKEVKVPNATMQCPEKEQTEWTRYDADMEEQMKILEKELDEKEKPKKKKVPQHHNTKKRK